MATVNNSQTLLELREAAQLQQGKDSTPQLLGDRIIPVMEVNPKLLRRSQIVRTVSRTASGGPSTMYTTPTMQDFFLTGLWLSFSKNAACDISTGNVTITVTPFGESGKTFTLPVLTLTEERQCLYWTFPPLKLARNTTIALNSTTYAAGLLSVTAGCIGYVVDNPGG